MSTTFVSSTYSVCIVSAVKSTDLDWDYGQPPRDPRQARCGHVWVAVSVSVHPRHLGNLNFLTGLWWAFAGAIWVFRRKCNDLVTKDTRDYLILDDFQ